MEATKKIGINVYIQIVIKVRLRWRCISGRIQVAEIVKQIIPNKIKKKIISHSNLFN